MTKRRLHFKNLKEMSEMQKSFPSFRFFPGIAVVILAAILLLLSLSWGELMLPVFTLLLLPALSGFLLGKRRTSPREYYFFLFAGVIIAMLIGALYAIHTVPAGNLSNRISSLQLVLTGSAAPAPSHLSIFGSIVCFAAFVNLCFFYGRMNGESTGRTLQLSLFCLIFIPLSLSFFTVAFLTFFFFGEPLYNAAFVSFSHPFWIFIFSFLVFLIRLLASKCSMEFSWKRYCFELSVLAAVSIALWGISFAYAFYLKNTVLTEVRRQGILWNPDEYFAFMKGQKNGAEVIHDLERQMAEIDGGKPSMLPYESVGNWLEKDDGKQKKPVTEREKAEEIAKLQTPAYETFFRTLKTLEQYDNYQFIHSFGWDTKLPHLLPIRRFMRRVAGRAAVAHYRKQTDKIIPCLKDGLPLEKSLRQEPCLISQLIRIEIVNILVGAVVRLGPDRREYLPDYRMFLVWLQSLTFPYIEDSVQMCAYQLSRNISLNDPIDATRSDLILRGMSKWFLLPLEFKGMADYIRASMELRQECLELIGRPRIPLPRATVMKSSKQEKSSHLIMLKNRNAKGVNETVLALKIHRAEHGSYPETTEELIPEILKTLPLDPFTGKPYTYRRIGNHGFELEYQYSQNSPPMIFSSVPYY